MKIEDQVCTLEQAKKLKELGVKQESIFNWIDDSHMGIDYKLRLREYTFQSGGFTSLNPPIAAYTLSELGHMLPSETYTIRRGSETSAYANWEWVDEGGGGAYGLFSTEAAARAALLIRLLSDKVISAHKVNSKLAK